jgi:hypothetical protein
VDLSVMATVTATAEVAGSKSTARQPGVNFIYNVFLFFVDDGGASEA